LDATGVRARRIEDAPESRYLNREVAFLDHGIRPDGAHDLVLRDKSAVPFDQHADHVERAGANGDRHERSVLIPPEQPARAPVEAEISELKDVRRDQRIHVCLPLCRAIGSITMGRGTVAGMASHVASSPSERQQAIGRSPIWKDLEDFSSLAWRFRAAGGNGGRTTATE
jgi:hypothetical protein